MTPRTLHDWRWPAWAAAVAALASGAQLAAAILPPLALINESPSVPRGVYLRVFGGAPVPGALVALPQPAASRPYLARLGMPVEVRLLKRVAAGPGDRVCRTGRRVEAGGRVVWVSPRDRHGQMLPQWRDCRILGPDELFLLGDTAASFDSRYFGPVRTTDLVGVFRESVTW